MWRFLTGEPARSVAVVPQSRIVLDGTVIGSESFGTLPAVPTNRPQVGASVEVFATDAATGQRLGPAVHRSTIGPEGRWGPLAVAPGATLEFVVAAPGHATTHIYRSPFARSSAVAHLRAERLGAAQAGATAVVTLSRPRGYFDLARDRIALDGHEPPAGIPPGVAGVSLVSVTPADAPGRSVVGVFNGERIAAWTWPAGRDELTVLELTG
jgi:hypothetical protein